MNVTDIGLEQIPDQTKHLEEFGRANSQKLQNFINSTKFDGELLFPKGIWPLHTLNLSGKEIVFHGFQAKLLQTGVSTNNGYWIFVDEYEDKIQKRNVRSSRIVIRDLIFEANDTSPILSFNSSESVIVDGVTTIGGTYGINLRGNNFDIHIRDCFVYGATEVGIYVGSIFSTELVPNAYSNIEIFISNTRIHGCKTPACCTFKNARNPEFEKRTKYGLLIEAATSGLYANGVSLAWMRDSGIATNAVQNAFPPQFLFFTGVLSDSIRKYSNNDNGYGWFFKKVQDAYLSNCWSGSAETIGVYVDEIGNNQTGDKGIFQLVGTKIYNSGLIAARLIGMPSRPAQAVIVGNILYTNGDNSIEVSQSFDQVEQAANIGTIRRM